jgi:hypothetical protein
MQLYALCLHPLLTIFKEKRTKLQIGKNGRRTAVVAYANDVTLLVSSPNELPIIMDSIQTFEKASGAQINLHKSKALAIARWDTTNNRRGIDFSPQIKILRVTFTC